MTNNGKKTIFSKTLIAFLTISIIPLFILILSLYLYFKNVIEDEINIKLRNISSSTLKEIDNRLYDYYANVQSWAEVDIPKVGLYFNRPEGVRKYFNKLIVTYKIYDLILITDNSGTIFSLNDVDINNNFINTETVLGKNVSNEPWFLEAKGNKNFINDWRSSPLVDSVYHNGGYSIQYSVPLYSLDNEFIGVLSAFVSWQAIQEIIDKIEDFYFKPNINTGYGFLVRGDFDTLIAHPDRSYYGKSIQNDFHLKQVYDDLKSGKKVLNYIFQGVEATASCSGSYEKTKLMKLDWILCIRAANKDIYANVDQLKLIMLAVFILTAFVAILFSVKYSRKITIPIAKLKRKTEEIAKGNYNSLDPIDSDDEIKDLDMCFNDMVSKLKTTMNSLEDLNRNLESKVQERTEELNQANKELTAKNDQLKELDRLKSDFFANVSHEIRTPLMLLLSPLQMMKEEAYGKLSLEQHVVLDSMQRNTERLLRLMNNILDFAKIEHQKMQLTLTRVNFYDLVNYVIQSAEIPARMKKIDIHLIDNLTTTKLLCDRYKIEKVLFNLLSNAIKFTEDGGSIEVTLSNTQEYCEVSVKDTGIGIPKTEQEHIFERFRQVDSSSSRKYEGSGIGLALVKEFIELHDGKIWVESKEGQGSTFTFSIPIRALENTKEETIDQHAVTELSRVEFADLKQSQTMLIHHTGTREKKERILIIEDNLDIQAFIISLLDKEYHCEVAHNGDEGITRAQAIIPDLIITDIMMPIKDGYEVCKSLRENNTTKHIPIIVITGKYDLNTKLDCLREGASDYLVKPFNAHELMIRVESLLREHRLTTLLVQKNKELEETLKSLRATQSHLIQSEKMASLGLLASGLAHEINNPTNFITTSLDPLKRYINELLDNYENTEKHILSPEEIEYNQKGIDELITYIEEGARRIAGIVRGVSELSRKDEGSSQVRYNINTAIENTLSISKNEYKHFITIKKELGDVPDIACNPSEINQVLLNILMNSYQAVKEKFKEISKNKGGEIHIKTYQDNDFIKIVIKDNGIGIKQEYQEKVFDPFFTTKKVGEGTGLGLSISYNIIKNHKGYIKVNSEYEQYSEFIIDLPIAENIGIKKMLRRDAEYSRALEI